MPRPLPEDAPYDFPSTRNWPLLTPTRQLLGTNPTRHSSSLTHHINPATVPLTPLHTMQTIQQLLVMCSSNLNHLCLSQTLILSLTQTKHPLCTLLDRLATGSRTALPHLVTLPS